MATTAAYALVGDLLLGAVPVPSDAQMYVDQAAEEIDSRIGIKYATPVVVDNSVESRPTALLLKKINIWLASGRLVLAKNAGKDLNLHAYGKYMVDQATAALDSIVNGTVILPGAALATADATQASGPVSVNADDYSPVEEFGSVFGNPANTVLQRSRIVLLGSPYTW